VAWIDRFAPHLPKQLGAHTRLELSLYTRELSPAVTRLTPWLIFVLDLEVTEFTFRVCRLPGRKVAELWRPEHEAWFGTNDVWEDDQL